MEKVLLSVLAHPDDESFGMGGTLAKYAAEGVKVHLVCATKGEAGEVDPEYLADYDSVADLREAELRCAAKYLGLNEMKMLNYCDSGMTGSPANNDPDALINAPLEEVSKEIADYIRQIKPQVICTFDPVGGYRHPDHIYIHQATLKAFHLAGDPDYVSSLPTYQPQRLYYHTVPRHFIRFNIKLLRLMGKDPTRYGKNQDIDLTQLAEDDFPIHARINYSEVKHKKDLAAACHASQGGAGLTRGVMRLLRWLIMGAKPVDQFMQAYPVPQNNQVSEDLFEEV